MEEVNKKKIARNTIFLYFRMLLVMGISLYTSRVILEILGVTDFGIYQSVGGIVGMLTFVNSALSSGTSRFITYELGRNDARILRDTFSTTLTMQLILVAAIVLIAETGGTWFVTHKLTIPAEKMTAAVWAYHLSIITTALTLVTVPFLALIIAHEKMNTFAYVGIIEVCAKLGIVYALTLSNASRLVMYAALLLGVQVMVSAFYFFYCRRSFGECSLRLIIDRPILKRIAGFSGWNLFASTSIALNNQGVLVLLNMFFSPAVVAARAISLQVNNAANQFVSNFRTAVNPQIVKQYALGNYDQSKGLLLTSTKFSYYLMLLLCLPICLGAKPLLGIWLKVVPDYTVIFLQLVIVQSLFQVFDTSFYTALYAKGDLKMNALLSPTLGFLMFPVVYVMFRCGLSPVALSWASLVVYALLGLVVKPLLIIKIVDYTWRDVLSVFRPCLLVTAAAGVPAYLLTLRVGSSGIGALCAITAICLTCSIAAIYFLGLTKSMKHKVLTTLQRTASKFTA